MSERNGKVRQRRHFSPAEKATILRRHLADKVPISDLCEEYQIQPSLVYIWQRQAFEHLDAVFQEGRPARADVAHATREQARVAALEAKLAKKDAVIAEVSEEYLALKTKLGES